MTMFLALCVVVPLSRSSTAVEAVLSNSPLPPNDHCSDAIGALAVDGSIIDGDSHGATVDMTLSWGLAGQVGYGVWYTVQGTGNTMVASLGGVDFGTGVFMGGFWVTVFAGSKKSCDTENNSLKKVGHEFAVSKSRHSSVWPSVAGQVYYLWVYTHDPLYLQTFHMAVTSLESASSSEGFSEQTAIEIQPDNHVYEGSISSFQSPYLKDDFGEFQFGGGLVWYKIRGDGSTMVRRRDNRLSDDGVFFQLLHIVNATKYVVSGDKQKNNRDFVWKTDANEWYHLKVDRQVVGADKYGFSVFKAQGLPVNDLCQNAIELELNALPLVGTTRNATFLSLVGRPDPSSCLYLRRKDGHRGVWYKVRATGKHLQVLIHERNASSNSNSSSSSSQSYSPYTYHLFTASDDDDDGNCKILNCTGAMMQAGRLNYIYVKPKTSASSTGDFEVSIQELEPPANNRCEDAEPLAITTKKKPVVIALGSFENALSSADSGPEVLSVWYRFVGNGETTTALLSQEPLKSWARKKGQLGLSVFAGSACDDLVCIAGCGTDMHTVTIETEQEQEYMVLVYSNLPASHRHTFTLRLGLSSPFLLEQECQKYELYTTCPSAIKDPEIMAPHPPPDWRHFVVAVALFIIALLLCNCKILNGTGAMMMMMQARIMCNMSIVAPANVDSKHLYEPVGQTHGIQMGDLSEKE